MNGALGLDPILTGLLLTPLFYGLGALVYRVYYASFERRGEESLRGLVFFFGILFIMEVSLSLTFGVDYRLVQTAYTSKSIDLGGVGIAFRYLVPCLVGIAMTAGLYLFLRRTFYRRAIMAVSPGLAPPLVLGGDTLPNKTLALLAGTAAGGPGRLPLSDNLSAIA